MVRTLGKARRVRIRMAKSHGQRFSYFIPHVRFDVLAERGGLYDVYSKNEFGP